MPLLRVAIAQFDVKLGDRAANYKQVEEMLAANWVTSELPTAVILPEIWDVGYAIEEAEKYGDRGEEQAAAFLGRLAREYDCWFAGGSVLALTSRGAQNRAMAVNQLGKYVAYYDKAHLIALMDEEKYLAPGEWRTHVDIGGVDVGLCICYDLRYPEWQRLYAVEGAQALFFSAEWPKSRAEHWQTMLRSRAIENQCYVAGCNRVGVTGGTVFGGRSVVVDPWGEILCECGEEPCFAFVEIDSEKADRARAFLQTFTARRPMLYKEF